MSDYLQWKVESVLLGRVNSTAITIEADASESSSFEVTGARNLSVVVPAEWDDADIGLQVSDDNETFIPLRDRYGNRVKVTGIQTAESASYQFGDDSWQLCTWIYAKLESLDPADDTAEAQTAERSLSVRRGS